MAFRDNKMEWNTPQTQRIFGRGFFNLTMAVGGREHGSNLPAPNLLTDMQLVFYFSFIIYRDGDKSIFPSTSRDSFSTTPAQINYLSENTKKGLSAMIWRFQEDLKRRGQAIYQDGRCDPAHKKISGYSHTLYTIMMYNSYYEHTVRNFYNQTNWQEYLLSDPLLPDQVRFELKYGLDPYSYM